MAKLPSFQFYPGDWQKDPNLKRCSHGAKGVWMDMLCLMFECDERGYLITEGNPWTIEEIASACGGALDQTTLLIDELLKKGVAKKDDRGSIYSARMVRDEGTRKERAKAGSKGGSKTQAKRKQTPEDEDEEEKKYLGKRDAGENLPPEDWGEPPARDGAAQVTGNGNPIPDPKFDQLEAFDQLFAEYPPRGKHKRSKGLRLWCEIAVNKSVAERISGALSRYKKHLQGAGWSKQPMDFPNWLEEWADWERWEEPEDPKTKTEALAERLKVKL